MGAASACGGTSKTATTPDIIASGLTDLTTSRPEASHTTGPPVTLTEPCHSVMQALAALVFDATDEQEGGSQVATLAACGSREEWLLEQKTFTVVASTTSSSA
jgi:hypothetical protein